MQPAPRNNAAAETVRSATCKAPEAVVGADAWSATAYLNWGPRQVMAASGCGALQVIDAPGSNADLMAAVRHQADRARIATPTTFTGPEHRSTSGPPLAQGPCTSICAPRRDRMATPRLRVTSRPQRRTLRRAAAQSPRPASRPPSCGHRPPVPRASPRSPPASTIARSWRPWCRRAEARTAGAARNHGRGARRPWPHRAEERMTGGLSEQERRQLFDLLQRCARALEAPAREPAGP